MVLPPLGLGHHPGEGNFHAARSWNKDLACSPTSHLKWGTSTLGELKKSLTRNLVALWSFGYKRFTEYTFIFEDQNRIICIFMKALLKMETTISQILSNLIEHYYTIISTPNFGPSSTKVGGTVQAIKK